VGRTHGLGEAELDALADAASSALFSAGEKAALAYAEAVTGAGGVPDALFQSLRNHFPDEAIIELTAAVTWEICAAKFNRALEIEGQGVCRVREPR
jgi:alkylhydroperoxidase family enzyme